ncbi:hypothetical protein GJAV_G00245720 [Gymnothorax javanicus]|nr:hypothetical protein GJAV_G00245720 [Gymnothorax javanicus]
MGANAISFAAVLSLVISAVFTQALSPTVVQEMSGGSATLPCDGTAYRGLPDKKIRDGNFSLTINPVKLSDGGNYECMWGKGQSDQRVLKDVRLYVSEPPVPNSLSVRAGESVTLPCFRIIHKWASEPLHLVWKRGEEPVVELRSEEITYGKMYEGRASVSPSLIQDGDFSLTINNAGLCDAGKYTCVSGPKQRATSVKLEIKDYRRSIPVNVSLGKPFSLSLPSAPVMGKRIVEERRSHFLSDEMDPEYWQERGWAPSQRWWYDLWTETDIAPAAVSMWGLSWRD